MTASYSDELRSKDDPLVSVIVVNYNGKDITDRCLQSLLKTDYANYEVIVIDNGSSDGSLGHLGRKFGRDPRICLIANNTNLGFAGGVNSGIKCSRGEFLVLLNNDTLVEPNWLEELVVVMRKDPSIGMAQSKLILAKDPTRLDSAGAYLGQFGFLIQRGFREIDRGQYDEVGEVFSVKAASAIVSAKLLKEIGAFDSSYFAYLEETDLCFRIWLSGHRVVFVPRSRVVHEFSYTTSKMLDIFRYHSCKNYIMTLVKNLELNNLIRLLPVHMCIWALMTLAMIKQRKLSDARLVMRAIVWTIENRKNIWRERLRVQHFVRKIKDKQIFDRVLRKAALTYYISHARYFI